MVTFAGVVCKYTHKRAENMKFTSIFYKASAVNIRVYRKYSNLLEVVLLSFQKICDANKIKLKQLLLVYPFFYRVFDNI